MTKETREQKKARWNAAIDKTEFPDSHAEIVKEALKKYSGDITMFESAIGALFVGTLVGWRPLFIMHSPKTIRRYESILGLGFRDVLPETTDLSDRSKGYEMVMAMTNFWSAVRGQTSVQHRTEWVDLDGLNPAE